LWQNVDVTKFDWTCGGVAQVGDDDLCVLRKGYWRLYVEPMTSRGTRSVEMVDCRSQLLQLMQPLKFPAQILLVRCVKMAPSERSAEMFLIGYI
jgi:hypothetical protein